MRICNTYSTRKSYTVTTTGSNQVKIISKNGVRLNTPVVLNDENHRVIPVPSRMR